MAKVTHNSDKKEDVFKEVERMSLGDIGVINGAFVIRTSNSGIVDLKDGYSIATATTEKVRILRPDESITLRNE